MKYLVITELFAPTKGGTAVWFDQVYRRMGGKEVHIVTSDVKGAAELDAVHPNTIHRISLKRHRWLRPESLIMYLKLLGRCLYIVTHHRFDAVHAGRVLPEGLVGWVIARLIHKPLVIYAHGEEITTWSQPAKSYFMKFVYRHADKVVANSEFTRNELRKLGIDENNIVIIHPGVDVESFRPGLAYHDLCSQHGLGQEQTLVLSVGRLSRRKGFDQVIRAIPILMLNGIDVHYAIIGIGEDEKYLRKLACEMNVSERVHFLGHVAPEDLPRWYNACDVFAMPNREVDGDTEGFGMVFIEAAACRKPSIAGKAGGTGAAVIDGVTGIRVQGEDLDDIVQSLKRLAGDPALARQMGEQGYHRVLSEFDWNIVAKKTAELND